MRIEHLSLRDFRNAEESEIDFSSGVNVICGANAAGKTNILEAIFYFAAGKSFRNCKDRELIRFGCEKGQIGIRFATENVSFDMSATLNKSGRRAIRIGEGQPLKMTEYIGKFRAVIFTPDHLSLVKGTPENRRRFLDLAICQSFPRYAPTLNEYNRVLAQKNALLKRGNVIDELLEVYNERLASLAAVITVNRKKYVQRLEEEAEKFLLDMSGNKEKLTLSYQSQAGSFETLEELKEKYSDLMRGAPTGTAAVFVLTQMLKVNLFDRSDFACLQIPTSYDLGITINLDKSTYIDQAHRRNIAVQYWTINDAETMRELIELGCDCIMTDDPALLQSVLDEYRNK